MTQLEWVHQPSLDPNPRISAYTPHGSYEISGKFYAAWLCFKGDLLINRPLSEEKLRHKAQEHYSNIVAMLDENVSCQDAPKGDK